MLDIHLNDMKATNDVWNMCKNKCIVNSWLFGQLMLIKGVTISIITECIINTTLRCCIPKPAQRILMKITMCLFQAIQAIFEDRNV